jgi:hypothetical protein
MTTTTTVFQKEMTASPCDDKLWQRERAILAVSEMICEILNQERISKAELAKRLEVGRSNITQLLDTANLQVTSIADMCTALGYEFCPIARKREQTTPHDMFKIAEIPTADQQFGSSGYVSVSPAMTYCDSPIRNVSLAK